MESRRRGPAPAGEASDHAGVIAHPPHILAAATCLGLVLDLCWPRRLAGWPGSLAVATAAGAASAGLALWARSHLLTAGTAIDPREGTTVLVTSGPYRWSRNPLYVAQGLLLVMAAGLLNSLAVLATLVPWGLVMQLGVVAREERYLAFRFGASYHRYRLGVRRWL